MTKQNQKRPAKEHRLAAAKKAGVPDQSAQDIEAALAEMFGNDGENADLD